MCRHLVQDTYQSSLFHRQDSVHQQTMRAIKRLKIRIYRSPDCSGSQHQRGAWGSASSNSNPVCAICLEEFQDGQVGGGDG